MNTRNLITTFFAFCLAASVAVLAYFLQKPRSVVTQVKQEETQLVSLLLSKSTLKPGDLVDINKFEWEQWPKDSVDPQYFTKENEAELQKLKGSVVRYQITKGEPLKRSDIMMIGDKSIVTAFINANKRAVSIPLSRVDNPSVHFAPGDFVDIILPNRNKDGESQVNIFIKGVKVIAVDDRLEQPQSGKALSAVPKTITVEVDPNQAQLLAESILDSHIVISHYSAFAPPKDGGNKGTERTGTIKVLRGSGDGSSKNAGKKQG